MTGQGSEQLALPGLPASCAAELQVSSGTFRCELIEHPHTPNEHYYVKARATCAATR